MKRLKESTVKDNEFYIRRSAVKKIIVCSGAMALINLSDFITPEAQASENNGSGSNFRMKIAIKFQSILRRFFNIGVEIEITYSSEPFNGGAPEKEECILCGECAQICPNGSIIDNETLKQMCNCCPMSQ